MSNLKKLLAFGLMFVLVLIIGACSGDEATDEGGNDTEGETEENTATPAGEKVKIEFWHAMSGPNQQAIDDIVADYNASQEK